MSAQFTPGPWMATGRYIGTKNHMSFIGECRSASGCWTDDEPASANARLIAAAPTLLEALEMLVADFGDYPASERPCLAFDKARAAISSARGAGK